MMAGCVVMRRALLGLLPLLAASGQGAASSFVVLSSATSPETPSIVMLGAPAAPVIDARPLASTPAGAEIYQLGPSVLAFGADAIPAAREAVASIAEDRKPPRRVAAAPLVFRGGEAGEAFLPASASAPASGQAATASPARQPQQARAPSAPEPPPSAATSPVAPFRQAR